MRTRLILAMVALGFLLSGCEYSDTKPTPTPTTVTVTVTPEVSPPTWVPDEMTIEEHELGSVEVYHPTQLNVVLESTGDPEKRCLELGGEYRLAGVRHYCIDVNY